MGITKVCSNFAINNLETIMLKKPVDLHLLFLQYAFGKFTKCICDFYNLFLIHI